jgi:hypothetical protein
VRPGWPGRRLQLGGWRRPESMSHAIPRKGFCGPWFGNGGRPTPRRWRARGAPSLRSCRRPSTDCSSAVTQRGASSGFDVPIA